MLRDLCVVMLLMLRNPSESHATRHTHGHQQILGPARRRHSEGLPEPIQTARREHAGLEHRVILVPQSGFDAVAELGLSCMRRKLVELTAL